MISIYDISNRSVTYTHLFKLAEKAFGQIVQASQEVASKIQETAAEADGS